MPNTAAPLITAKHPALSFEFFPPKDADGEQRFWNALEQLARFKPDFISMTYGAGGSSKNKTAELVCEVQRRFGLTAMAHLTCVGEQESDLRKILDHYQANAITHLLALRGDPPKSADGLDPAALLQSGSFTSSEAFVAFIRANYPQFRLGVAAYPEKHPEAPSLEAEVAYFKRKIAAGADFAITQFFFDIPAYFHFLDRCHQAGIDVPIIPGLIPISDYKQIARFAALCGAALPQWLTQRLEAIKDDPEAVAAAGIDIAINQCRELLSKGVPGLHFFTLNRAEGVSRILEGLDLSH